MVRDREHDLEAGLAGLAEILGRRHPFEQALEEVAAFAAFVIPGADGAGLTLLEPDRADTVVASADFVEAVDDVQYRVGEGPGVLAVEQRLVQISGSLGGDSRWPRFGPQAGRLGVHSALSLPLIIGSQTVGALSVYGRADHAFDQAAVEIGRRFSGPAAVISAHALLLEEGRRVTEQLERGLRSRAVIDQAIGILMSRTGDTVDSAFQQLTDQSRVDGAKVSEVARQLVERAVARAPGRRHTAR